MSVLICASDCSIHKDMKTIEWILHFSGNCKLTLLTIIEKRALMTKKCVPKHFVRKMGSAIMFRCFRLLLNHFLSSTIIYFPKVILLMLMFSKFGDNVKCSWIIVHELNIRVVALINCAYWNVFKFQLFIWMK